ncbi:hypothetical protein GCWU000341_02686 [Oribacterium sp. oral taxon 078 str. F0262]|nr:hypothetical protein GCWU000341_02686 [Oribacterium sp. oral taxon 078 str. F0262]
MSTGRRCGKGQAFFSNDKNMTKNILGSIDEKIGFTRPVLIHRSGSQRDF